MASRTHEHHALPVALLMRALRPDRLREIAANSSSAYVHASPFPHAVIDDLFPAAWVSALEREIPERAYSAANASSSCNSRSADGRGQKCWESTDRNGEKASHRKRSVDSEDYLGPATRLTFALLRSASVVEFLQQLTGVDGLVPDPGYAGSGVHVTTRGGLLKLHADFNFHPTLAMRRRVNTFLFLNPAWPDEYGGHLELWDASMLACRQRILPRTGRWVVFSTTDFSYHGHPHPLSAPTERARRSLALYYYTRNCPREECADRDCSRRVKTEWRDPAVGAMMCTA
jgi:Rps23 Pro-64 3,4-dihydroxylase Tpa1-like proline 4-hydroxylase